MGRLFYVCFKRYNTLVQILNKESMVEAGLSMSVLFLVSYFMMMGLLAKTGIFLGVIALLMLGAFHLYVLKKFNINVRTIFRRAGTTVAPNKSYRRLKVESRVEDMLMEGLPMDDYKIIQRLILHFELKKPFLDSDLKMADITKQIYTNRSYLSRALNHRLAKNFNQFVNYYRVKEACKLYLENPELKGRDLAKMCGFKNLSSFSTSFSINLRYTPGEWCKEVKRRLNNNEEVSIKDYFS
ncbi:MAG: helix-turn-helix transcriptional regulator [Bacteroidales bacterium]|nr:helix-turn-helix transcriptional regulator [Bacteroidales bacterium]